MTASPQWDFGHRWLAIQDDAPDIKLLATTITRETSTPKLSRIASGRPVFGPAARPLVSRLIDTYQGVNVIRAVGGVWYRTGLGVWPEADVQLAVHGSWGDRREIVAPRKTPGFHRDSTPSSDSPQRLIIMETSGRSVG